MPFCGFSIGHSRINSGCTRQTHIHSVSSLKFFANLSLTLDKSTIHALMSRLPLLLLLLVPHFSLFAAQRFHSSTDESHWMVKSSPIYCELKHPISHYGDGRFVYSSGGELAFQLRVQMPAPRESVASLYSIAPFWRPAYEKELAQLTISQGKMPVYVGGSLALRMLYELQKGFDPTFHYKDWASFEDDVYVTLSSVNFHRQLDKFQHCINQALPYGADKLKDTRVYFDTNKSILRPEQRERLKEIALFASMDKSMRIQLFGYADDRGLRRYNKRLSERRTRAVRKYLISRGVSAEQISIRAYGERRPVASNRTERGRRHNRRVEVVIERG